VDYLQFKTWFDQEYTKLKTPADCSELLSPTVVPTSSVLWTFRWFLGFTDGKYIQIKEHYSKQAGLIQQSHRASFAYHYGPVVRKSPDGVPIGESINPVDIRIDTSHGPVHMHLAKPQPRYAQNQVKDLDMQDLGMFTFVKAICRHRASGKSLEETLHFRIV
jgi:hypothetical protein